MKFKKLVIGTGIAGGLAAIVLGGISLFGGWGSRGTSVEKCIGHFNRKSIDIVKEDIRFGPDHKYVMIDNRDIIVDGIIKSDEGKYLNISSGARVLVSYEPRIYSFVEYYKKQRLESFKYLESKAEIDIWESTSTGYPAYLFEVGLGCMCVKKGAITNDAGDRVYIGDGYFIRPGSQNKDSNSVKEKVK
ncbi:MAG: hypothetical protein PHH54_04365 [Candidatus Nanoarchaeia archaeon]|nr:hypothetical protein [Candidatus Nanoarchaeia archaeon]MDD5741194.1 hypothetical protein [Candidatus Nanoarchaeia archaeon]